MPKRKSDVDVDDLYPDQEDDDTTGATRKKLSSDQKKEILRIVETSLTAAVLPNQSTDHYRHDVDPSMSEKLSLDQRREVLGLIEQGIEVTGDVVTESSFQRSNRSGITITRYQKNEILLLVEQSLEAMVEEGSKFKRRHYTREQKDEMLALASSCAEEGMSTNAAIKYLNTIPGYEKVTRKMIRDWKMNRSSAPRGRKVAHEFETEVLNEIMNMTGHDITNPACNIKEIAFDEVRRAAIAVRDRFYEDENGQKWLLNPKTKDLHFSSNWIRKLFARGRAGTLSDDKHDPNNSMLELETDSDEEG